MTPTLEPLWYWLADYYALATCVLLAVVPILLGVKQPARRLVVGWSTLGGLLALLVFSLIPSWPRTNLDRLRAPLQQARLSSDETTVPFTTISPDEPRAGLAVSPLRRASDGLLSGKIEQVVQSEPSSLGGGDPPRTATAWPWLVLRAFLVGFSLMVAWLAIGCWRLALLRRRSRRAPEGARALLARVVGRHASPPELIISRSLRQPVAAGFLRPAIILPQWFLEEPENRLEAALAHEWSHIRNGDLRLIGLSRLLLPMLFAHPAYWWLRGRIRDDQEAVADASAAALGGRLNYAEVLLSWARSAPEPSWIAAGGAVALFERTSQLKRRIVMLLDGDLQVETTCPAWWRTATRVAAAAAVVAASLLTLRPTAVAKLEVAEQPGDSARLLDPDGKPFAGAKVYLSAPRRSLLKGGPTTPTPLGATGPDGSFRHPGQAGLDGEAKSQMVATAEGYGPAFADPSAQDAVKDLKLVKDDVPIQGHVLDVDGRPVAGATVSVIGVLWSPSGKLDEWLAALKTEKSAYPVQYRTLRWWAHDDVPFFFPPVIADKDGRFTIRGVGRERIASLLIEGPGVGTTFEYVATRRMPTLKFPDFSRQNQGGDITYHGAEFDLVLGPELVAVGAVTDKDTGAPLAGATVGTTTLFGNPLRILKTTTDAQGRYRLAGIPPRNQFNDEQDLIVQPADGLPYLPRVKRLGKGDGAKPIVNDLQLKRGVRARGRVVDKSTGKGVRAGLSYYILSDNPNLKSYPRYGTLRVAMPNLTDEGGNFDLIVMPGPGVLGARAWSDHYRLGMGVDSIEGAKGTDEDRKFIAAEPHHLITSNYHTVLGVNPKPGEETVAFEIALDRGRSVKGRVVDANGEPMAGARIEGLQDHFRTWSHEPMPSAEFLVEGIGEGASRDLLVYHEGKKLAGAFVIGPDDAGPITVKLEPCGTAIGRLVEAGGPPLAEVEMTCDGVFKDGKHEAGSLPGVVKTGKDGRFRAEGLVPGRKYTFKTWKREKGENKAVTAAKDVVVSRGETKDLGDVPLDAGE
ncbi:MAG: M56 family metallopeptidase [Paludisphaera borealis]|uniref:M56 family metallopeptidase n=1 Tax=Paludisphaera borealis TaxID=1387353 RepID=UPI0028453085|nr:M56 family metallopeptidase [Paludisphaera borealis]MDR3620620.1 M56 family metallopeptidase [Paludisphaera borealis]